MLTTPERIDWRYKQISSVVVRCIRCIGFNRSESIVARISWSVYAWCFLVSIDLIVLIKLLCKTLPASKGDLESHVKRGLNKVLDQSYFGHFNCTPPKFMSHGSRILLQKKRDHPFLVFQSQEGLWGDWWFLYFEQVKCSQGLSKRWEESKLLWRCTEQREILSTEIIVLYSNGFGNFFSFSIRLLEYQKI